MTNGAFYLFTLDARGFIHMDDQNLECRPFFQLIIATVTILEVRYTCNMNAKFSMVVVPQNERPSDIHQK